MTRSNKMLKLLLSRLLQPIFGLGVAVCTIMIVLLGLAGTPAELSVSSSIVGQAQAASCRDVELNQSRLAAWYDPKPQRTDRVRIPLPLTFGDRQLSVSMVFTRIGFRESGLFPVKGATFQQGSNTPEPFETSLRSRVTSAMRDRNGRSILYLGTYEVSRGQYALVMGGGDLARGLEHLLETSGDSQLKSVRDFVDPHGPCHGKMTRQLHNQLRLPISFLPMDGYHSFVERLNRLCSRHKPCAEKLASLSNGEPAIGFFRLPLEHEWAFAARGAYSYTRGDITAADLQRPIPAMASGTRLEDFAHVDNQPPRLLPIGSHESLHGFHDIIGNVQELMANRFTSETASGAVGGALARGGSFRTPVSEIRISRRTELTPYRRHEKTGAFFAQSFPLTGMRLAIGLPLNAGLGRTTLEKEFATSFIAVDEIGDGAGDSLASARELGSIVQVRVNDELGAGDQSDIYGFVLDGFGPLEFGVRAGGKSVATLMDEGGNQIERLSVRPNDHATARTDPLYPNQKYYLRIEARSPEAHSFSYNVDLAHSALEDTGVDKADPVALRYATEIRNRVTELSGFVGFTGRN